MVKPNEKYENRREISHNSTSTESSKRKTRPLPVSPSTWDTRAFADS